MVDLIIAGITKTLSGIQIFDNVEITNNGVLKVAPYDGTPTSGMLEIHAKRILVDATSIISADAAGYRGQKSTSGCGEGEGAGCGGGFGGSGAGYGGNGGKGGMALQGGPTYGTLDGEDIDRGSGGGCAVYFTEYGIGGNGGGVISLYSHEIIIEGKISANGGSGTSMQHGSGGGSGGGLLLYADNIVISGHLDVNGGNGSNSNTALNRGGGGGGGGGRIKIVYTSIYTNTGLVSYGGGAGGYGSFSYGENGQTGTINVALRIVKFGSLSFTSIPQGAKIYLAPTGQNPVDQAVKTPETITNIPVGIYVYILKMDGFNDYEGTVTILENQTATVEAAIDPAEGCIYFNTTPQGANIYIDDVDTGQVTPSLLCGVSLGIHTYRLMLAGYYEAGGAIPLIPGQGTTIIASPFTEIPKKGIGTGTITGLILLTAGVLGAIILRSGRKTTIVARGGR